jgi:hypothetical protein
LAWSPDGDHLLVGCGWGANINEVPEANLEGALLIVTRSSLNVVEVIHNSHSYVTDVQVNFFLRAENSCCALYIPFI